MSFILSILPILWLIIALCIIKLPGYKACLITAIITAIIGIAYFKMTLLNAASAALEGALNALWPICMVIIAALFTYNLTVSTGAMEKIKAMLASVTSNKLVLCLLIGWGFGNFMEGMAGFGTAVAIPAGILVAMGFDPLTTVVACLVVNSTPTAFGSVGVPTATLASVTGLEVLPLCSNIAIIQLVCTLLSPFLMVIIVGKGLKALKGVWGITLIAAVSFVVPQFIAAKFIGAELPNIIGSIISMICIIAAAIMSEKKSGAKSNSSKSANINIKDAAVAWSPFILIFVILLFTSSLFPVIHDPIAKLATKAAIYNGENPGTLTFSWIDCPGVKILIAGILGGLIQKASPGKIFTVLTRTLQANIKTIITICSVLATAKIMGYSGMISAIAVVLVAVAGNMYPLIAPFIGVIGGFVTGSGTSTSVLFGSLQVQTAEAIGANPVWLGAANMLGAGVGKMVSPQGIAIGAAAAGLDGKESTILSKTFKYALLYAVIGGIICFTGAALGI